MANVNRKTALHAQYLDAMGIQRWVARSSAVPEAGVAVTKPGQDFVADAADGSVALLDWDTLQARVAACTLCGLHQTRTQTVFGVGDRNADWLIVGEAPGADEDRQGEPFVGRAGQLLNAMIEAIGMKREQVYIANVLKCRPPGNRDPQPGEVAHCEPYLQRQVELIRPKIILALGRIAAQNLLKTDTRVGALRGKAHRYSTGAGDAAGVPLVVTYHPAYLLRSPSEKRKAWQDLQFAVKISRGQT
ncbi:MAG: DNA polymerase bacteriophage-type [Gammaproteobacteria bacterium]|nr:MAG: DNA polymerase bacteriophage-type [Gammaproteobacteria bacterium]TND01012.1 MAG: DNA polymerase bacteriophage-type [Gammaproteobacteria bacterium]